MKRVSFQSRLEEVIEEKGTYNSVAEMMSITRQALWLIRSGKYDVNFKTVEKIAEIFDLIPIVFYTKDGEIINLGVKGFPYKRGIDHYVVKVFEEYRGSKTQREVADKASITPGAYQFYVLGKSKPRLSVIEAISKELNIVPAYLVKPQQRRT